MIVGACHLCLVFLRLDPMCCDIFKESPPVKSRPAERLLRFPHIRQSLRRLTLGLRGVCRRPGKSVQSAADTDPLELVFAGDIRRASRLRKSLVLDFKVCQKGVYG